MNKTLPALFILLLCAIAQPGWAQVRTCGSMDYLQQQILDDPARQAALDEIERHTEAILSGMERSAVTGVITIPVVVHVVYNTTAENISTAQIQSQINVLNQDFRRTNSDATSLWPQAADSEIEFCLASVDPSGASTTGITRTSTTRTSFSSNDYVKFNANGGKDAWPAGSYLNIWVCDLGSGLLGYAQFPGGPASTDGVVIDYQYFGTTGTATAPFNLGRTATHEVGHWLNLRHIWGDGGCSVDDFVSDTPTSDAPNYGCPTGHVSCGTTDMIQNYMDYTDDGCMNLYTTGQKTRMRALFDAGGSRISLLSSGGCGSSPAPTCSDGIQNGSETGVDCGGSCPPCPTGCTENSLTLSITFDNYPEETSWTLQTSGGSTVASGGTYGSQPDGSTLVLNLCVPNGCYVFTMNDSYGDGMCCSYGSGSYTLTGPSGTLASGGTFTTSQSTSFCLGGSPAPTCTDGIQNGTETGVDCGGSCPPCPMGCSYTTISNSNFESGWGAWTDGGTDCRRSSADASYANGTYCVRLRDNTTTSVMSTGNMNLSAYNKLKIDFSFITSSFETGEDFWLQYSTNGGSTYTTIVSWVAGTDFSNLVRSNPSIILTGTFGSTFRLRFRADASADDDLLFIDDAVIQACNEAARIYDEYADFYVEINGEEASVVSAMQDIHLYPNPARDQLQVEFDLVQQGEWNLIISDLTGKVLSSQVVAGQAGRQTISLNTASYAPGMYFVYFSNGTERMTRKFSIVR